MCWTATSSSQSSRSAPATRFTSDCSRAPPHPPQPFGSRDAFHERLQPRRRLFVERNLEASAAAILDLRARLAPDGVDPRVVEPQAADREIEQRAPLVRLDVRREDTGRRLRRAAGDVARLEYRHAPPAHRQLARDGTADDAGA